MELCCGGSLHQKLKKEGKLSEGRALIILKGILKGVEYLHSKNIMHRDLKLENIMFKNKLDQEICENIKIIDFGLALSLTNKKNPENSFLKCGTPGYISPEIFASKNSIYNEKCDIFSIGVIFHFM